MSEVTFDENKKGWVYVGRKKNGEPKFRKFTNETEEYVRSRLDEAGIAYVVEPRIKMFFIYKDKEPQDRYSSRYSYYYTTGKWGSDKRQRHYHSDGIDSFLGKFYKTTEQDKEERAALYKRNKDKYPIWKKKESNGVREED
jgi:hypothetical protein